MLKGIHPLLNGALLKALDEMGHGDSLIIADANFPSSTTSRSLLAPVIDLPGTTSPEVLEAVCTVFPIDTYAGPPLILMEAETGVDTAVQDELIAATGLAGDRIGYAERFEFYDLAANVHAIIRTGEGRPYGNALLRKGVVTPR